PTRPVRRRTGGLGRGQSVDGGRGAPRGGARLRSRGKGSDMKSVRGSSLPRGNRPYLGELEGRPLLSGTQARVGGQVLLEELHDARATPAAYGAGIGVDLSHVTPSQPLAFNPQLIDAARAHAQDMNDRGYFDHVTPDGVDPGQRISNAGVNWAAWGESSVAG